MFAIQATQIFGSKVFNKKAETLEEAKKVAKSYEVANCNIQVYEVLENGRYKEIEGF